MIPRKAGLDPEMLALRVGVAEVVAVAGVTVVVRVDVVSWGALVLSWARA
ncbi:hypothetical protein [Verrucomicrobium spinosum]|nr:hypothetical protein [Verrucomicrobium spinosum]